eukprot:CAMPEP_0181294138 /NCGR_PEP_ID=MMETSP1101-20121128/3435_1 /TAXON_ID=46948 /ORGANISM="Rhodomonas abbreviata, Strain Caron Lab Isolate" /LENGTH=611 /DNA_ID=CAMNT_0023398765 /DNA_START=80 /DNA_END=1915 /DNA_ORIENTATION=+
MAPSLVWPPPALWPLIKLGALLGLAYVWGLVLHCAFTGPTLLGEILSGTVLGPRVWDIVPHTEALILIGHLGKFVMVFERGIQVNPGTLRQAGGQAIGLSLVVMALGMLFVGIALRIEGYSMVESCAAGAVMTTMAVGVVDVGWARQELENVVPGRPFAGQLVACTGTVCSVLSMMVLSIMQGFKPGWYWWNILQPFLFSLAVLVACILFSQIWRVVCCAQLSRVFGRSSANTLFDGYEVVVVVMMLAFAVGMAVVCELVEVSPILGVFAAGLCFSGVKDARRIWKERSGNVSPWLSRIFFACTIGFLLPEQMWEEEKPLYIGLKVAAAALGGRFLAGLLAAWPFLVGKPRGRMDLLQVSCGVLLQGELGFILVVELLEHKIVDTELLAPLLWGLCLSNQLAPLLFQLCDHFSEAFTEEANDMGGRESVETSPSKQPLVAPTVWSPPAVSRAGQVASPATTFMPSAQDVSNTLAQFQQPSPDQVQSREHPSNPSTVHARPSVGAGAPGGKAQAMRNSMQYYSTLPSPASPPVHGGAKHRSPSPEPTQAERQAVQNRSLALQSALQAAASNPPPLAATAPVPPAAAPSASSRGLSVQSHIRRQYPALWADSA